MKSREIEVQLQFLKAKQLEFLKDQHQKQAVALAAAQAAAVAGMLCIVLFVCFVSFLWTPSFEGNWVSPMGVSLTSGAGIDGNAPYQAQELQITTLANLGIQTNFMLP